MSEGEPTSELSPGDEFGGYRIERRLGRGGMGIVYAAMEADLDREVALKLISPDAAGEGVFLERFRHESKIAARVEHPNVVPIYAAGEREGIPFIAMRYVSGSDLGKRIGVAGRLEPRLAAGLIAQVGAGLDAIHAAGLVHRDVKPANVLISGAPGSEHAYITDFGVARNVASTSGLTKTGRFVGTLDYVAPEQIRGGEVDARVDVYALACLLFKCLTGEVPFPRDGEAARLYAHLNDEPPAASLFTPLVPAALDRVIARGMAKDPADRYPSAGDLGRAAVAALSGDTVEVAERTVATGAAATGTAETRTAEPTGDLTDPSAFGEAAPLSASAAGETVAMPPTAEAPASAGATPSTPAARRPRSRLPLVLAGLAVAAVAAGAIALGTGGGNDSGGGRAGKEQPLTEDKLANRAGEICLASQNEFVVARSEFPNGETDINEAKPFSLRLTQISLRSVRRLARLVPPSSVANAYNQYVDARRRVHNYDIEARNAALRGSIEDFQAARQKNVNEGPERHRLAKKAGITPGCSPIPNPQG